MMLVQYDLREGVGYITLNRPKKRNALNADLVSALIATLEQAARDAQVVVLRGNGRSFCAGADLKEAAKNDSESNIRIHAQRTGELFNTLGALSVPTIAVVTGHALGAGCGLVSLCDMATAAADARLGYPEFGCGILPAIVTPPLVRAVGARRAFYILTRDTALDARAALDLGLITEVATDPNDAADRIACRLTAIPRDRLARFKILLRLSAYATETGSTRAAVRANIADRIARK